VTTLPDLSSRVAPPTASPSTASPSTASPSTAARGLTKREAMESDPLLDWWHPVAWSFEVGDTPHRSVLLGRTLVVWRDADGVARCFRDICLHRGTALSLGTITEGELVCAYHGWSYAADGRCTRIPQFPPDRSIPNGARAIAFQCEERHGIIWVCLRDEAKAPIPDFPEWGDPGYRHAPVPAYTWQTSAPRMVENFTDFGHLAWLHDGLLGSKEDGVVPAHDVFRKGSELHYELTMPVPAAGGINATSGELGLMTNTYVLSLPHAIWLRSYYHDTGTSRVLFFAAQPVTSDSSRGYCYQSRDFDMDGADAPYVEFQEILAEQDRPVVESQRPEELPLDLADELHMKFDQVAIEYRKALAANGLKT
jgi:phenylpropionate dioxygenase-like ring-hydroxylating dioxygenase large terminal subunit